MASFLKSTITSSFIAGGLLCLMTLAPERLRDPVMVTLRARLSPKTTQTVIGGLAAVFVFGLVGKINSTLNALAFGNWQMRGLKSKWNWEKEIAVVTGGCSGLGKALVEELLDKGLRVAIIDIGQLPEKFRDDSRITYVKTNITSIEEVRSAGDTIRKAFGNPSILINCAGVLPLGLILEGDAREVERNFTINTMAHFWTTREFVPSMIKQDKGHVVCIASMASFACMPGIVAYGCSKASALVFQEGLASELKHIYQKKGIMLTTVHPGNMDTNMLSKFHDDQQRDKPKNRSQPEVLAKRIVAQVQSGRGAQLILPDTFEFKIASMLRAFPNWLQEGFRDIGVKLGNDCPVDTLRARSKLIS